MLMLQLKSMTFPDNLLVIEEEPIFVDTKLSTSLEKTEDQIKLDKERRRYRTGKVIAIGRILEDNNSTTFTSSSTGNKLIIDIGSIVFYGAESVDVNDCPIEYENQPKDKRTLVYINRNFIQAIIEP